MKMYFNPLPSILFCGRFPGIALLDDPGASDRGRNGALYLFAGLSFYRIACDEDHIVTCRQRIHQSDTFLHEPSGSVAHHGVTHLLTGEEPRTCIGKTILFVEQDHIAVPYRFSLVIHPTEFTAACEHFLPAHTCTTKIRTPALCRQSLSSSCSSVLQNVTAASGLHSLSEAVFLFSLPCLGLKSHFHNVFPPMMLIDFRADLNSKPHIHTPN